MALYKDSSLTPISVRELLEGDKDKKVTDFARPFTFKIPNNAYYWSPENNKVMRRNMTPILPIYPYRMRSSKNELQEMIQLRFANSALPTPGVPGQITYNPDFLEIPEIGWLKTTEADLDLNFFLCNHPCNGSLKTRDIRRPVLFEIYDRKSSIKAKLDKSAVRYKAVDLIHGPMAMDKDELLETALLYWHKDAIRYGFAISPEEMDMDEIKQVLGSIAESYPEDFLKQVEGSEGLDLKKLINKAIAAKSIYYKQETMMWYLTGDQGQRVDMCQVKPGQDPARAVMEYLETDVAKNHLAALRVRTTSAIQGA